jgi:hypothetical protein
MDTLMIMFQHGIISCHSGISWPAHLPSMWGCDFRLYKIWKVQCFKHIWQSYITLNRQFLKKSMLHHLTCYFAWWKVLWTGCISASILMDDIWQVSLLRSNDVVVLLSNGKHFSFTLSYFE